jgi:hypothetical protein
MRARPEGNPEPRTQEQRKKGKRKGREAGCYLELIYVLPVPHPTCSKAERD